MAGHFAGNEVGRVGRIRIVYKGSTFVSYVLSVWYSFYFPGCQFIRDGSDVQWWEYRVTEAGSELISADFGRQVLASSLACSSHYWCCLLPRLPS